MAEYDLKITGGMIHEGEGGSPYMGDVGIKDGRIIAVGDAPGDADEVIDVARAITTCRELDEPPELVVLEDAGHFLHGRLTELRSHLQDFWQTDTPAA